MSGDDLTDSDDLGRKMMRQVAGAFMEYEKCLVAKLRGARDRRRKETGKKVGGRRAKGKGGRLSYREISDRLKDAATAMRAANPSIREQ